MTTNVIVWCRHKEDNLIGCGADIPWNEPQDKAFFEAVIQGEKVVFGRKTYESLPAKALAQSQVFILTSDKNYESKSLQHIVCFGQKDLVSRFNEDDVLYIGGGAKIYQLFMTGKEALKPQIIVDCVYEGEIDDNGSDRIDVSESVKIMEQKYRPISLTYQHGVISYTIWVRRGEFVAQSVLKKVLNLLEIWNF